MNFFLLCNLLIVNTLSVLKHLISEIVSILFGFYFNYVLYLYRSKEQAK